MKKSLPHYELSFLLSVMMVMVAFVVVAKVNATRASLSISNVKALQEVTVTITGEVSKPGNYIVYTGADVESVIKKAKPKKYANLEGIPLNKKIETYLTIDVKKLDKINVGIEGAVDKPIGLCMKPGTRVCDLKSKLTFTNDADLEIFKSRRQLLHGEVIFVPKKTVE